MMESETMVCLSQVYAEDCCDPCLLDLQNYLPRYYGTWSHPDRPHGKTFLAENGNCFHTKFFIFDGEINKVTAVSAVPLHNLSESLGAEPGL